MKVDFYDLLDTYEESEIKIGTSCGVSPSKIKDRTIKQVRRKQDFCPARIAVIAAVLVLCLGTTVLATSDLFAAVVDYLRASVDKDFGGNGDSGPDILATVSAGEDMDVSLYNGEAVFITNEGESWYFSEGQMVDVCVKINTEGIRSENDPGYGVYYGYVRCDENGNAMEQKEIYHEQIFCTSSRTFEIPEDGFYYFYFLHVSSDRYELDTFMVNVEE